MKKAAGWRYRILSAVLAVIFLTSQIQIPSLGAGTSVSISNEEEFLLLADQCRTEAFSTGKSFYLEKDLDLSGYDNIFIPVMAGLFDGNGHKITGVSLKEDMSDYGLFRYVGTSGTIRRLTVEGVVTSGENQENMGIIAGSNAGKIENCVSRGIVNGYEAVGGIAGVNEQTGRIIRSRNEAKIDGRTSTGGIAGVNKGSILDCTNTGGINNSQKVLKEMDGDGSVNISIPNAVAGLTSDERANETGGIAGNSSGSILDCINEGVIGHEHLGYATGGIVGRQNGSISGCNNKGIIYGRRSAGGIVGYFDPYEATAYDRDISRELEDQLDVLSDLVDELGDMGDRLGDHLSGNLDVLSDQMKALRNSLRGHLDQFGDMADESRDAINGQIHEVKETLDGVQFEVNLKKLNEHMVKIQQDMAAIQAILTQLQPILEQAGGEIEQEIEQAIEQYSQQLQVLQEALEALNQFIEHAGSASEEATSEEGAASEEEESPSAEETMSAGEGPSVEEHLSEEETTSEEETPSEGMVPMAFRQVAVTDEQSAQLEAAMEELGRLSADIQVQMQGITEILGTVPDEASELRDRFKTLGKNMDDLMDTLDGKLNDLSDELGNAKNDIRYHGNQISDSLDTTTDTFETDWDAISDQVDRIKNQFTNIRGTISDGFDELKRRIEDRSIYVDISELATEESGAGKIYSCINEGEVCADSQGGGIVGSIIKENMEDAAGWIFDQNSGRNAEEEKSGITKHVMAAIIRCRNTGEVSVQDDYAGGIVGRADYGAVFFCENYGDIISEDGSYVGGIAGYSEHGIRDSYVLCGLNGVSYVGGVAGKGNDILGSYVCVYMDMEAYVKSSGSIVGSADGIIEENWFVDNGYGAVDGVTRSQEATAVDYPSMLELKEMPENFTQFTVRFVDGEDIVWQNEFSYGEEFSKEDYPKLQQPEGEYAYWEQKDVSPIHRSVTIHAKYQAYVPSLSSGDSERHPEMLLGGEFYPDTTLLVREATGEEIQKVQESLKNRKMDSHYHVKQVYYCQISQEEPLRGQVTVRVADKSHVADCLMTMDENFEELGKIEKTETVGSYLSAETVISQNGYVVVMDRVDRWAVVLGAAAVILLGVLMLLLRHRRKQRACH